MKKRTNSFLGNPLKTIRTSKGYSQTYVAGEEIHQSAYSKIELNRAEPTLKNYLHILEKLDMRHQEFQFIANGYKYRIKDHILKSFFGISYNDTATLQKIQQEAENYLEETPDFLIEDISSLCKGLIAMAETSDIEKARPFANQVWVRLSQHDNWYLTDIRLINCILYLFPIDTAKEISKKALEQLKNYQDYENIGIISFPFKFNLVLLFLENKEYEEALQALEELVPLCRRKSNYTQLAICYARKGIALKKLGLKNGDECIQKAYEILTVMDEEKFKQELEKEVIFYLK